MRPMKRRVWLLSCLVLWAWPLGAMARGSVGVAPFESVAARGQLVPDVAGRLARRLGTRGLDKVVGPDELGAAPETEPAAEEIAGWARKAGVDHVLVGRTTRLGRSLSVDAHLYDAAGRAVGAPLVEEVTRVEDLNRAIEALADQVVERVETGAARVAARSAVSAAPPVSAGGGVASRRTQYDENSPISIKADQLESQSDGDSRKFLFRGNVRAVQDDLVVVSDRMEAFYPPGRSSPDRMVATGHVTLEQTDRIAHCRKAIFYRSEQKVVCTGSLAELEQDCDRVRGEEITFHLDTKVMHVKGAADVRLRPDDPTCASAVASSEAGQ